MDFQEYIKPELLVLIPVLYLIGMAIKRSRIDDRHIPVILGVCGVLLSALYLIATEQINGTQAVATAFFTAVTQGILLAGASVYVNQIIKQEMKGE